MSEDQSQALVAALQGFLSGLEQRLTAKIDAVQANVESVRTEMQAGFDKVNAKIDMVREDGQRTFQAVLETSQNVKAVRNQVAQIESEVNGLNERVTALENLPHQ